MCPFSAGNYRSPSVLVQEKGIRTILFKAYSLIIGFCFVVVCDARIVTRLEVSVETIDESKPKSIPLNGTSFHRRIISLCLMLFPRNYSWSNPDKIGPLSNLRARDLTPTPTPTTKIKKRICGGRVSEPSFLNLPLSPSKQEHNFSNYIPGPKTHYY